MNFQTINKQRKFMLIAAAIGLVAMFLPWITISIFGFSSNVNGMRGEGIIIFLCFAACLGISLVGDQNNALDKTMWMIALVASGLAALLMVIFFLRSIDAISFLGFGFYLALLAAVGLVYIVYNYRNASYNIRDGFDSLKSSMGEKKPSDSQSSHSVDSPPPPPPPPTAL